MIQRKNLLTLAAFIIFSFIFASCNKSGGPANGLSTKNTVWYVPGDIEGLNPITTADESAVWAENLLYEALTGQNPRTQGFIPSLAALPVESADHMTFTFTMDPTAHWSDGKPVTAEDVIFSYKIIQNPFVTNAAPISIVAGFRLVRRIR
jgi:peptide/nickel transport system substrate-binding protein